MQAAMRHGLRTRTRGRRPEARSKQKSSPKSCTITQTKHIFHAFSSRRGANEDGENPC